MDNLPPLDSALGVKKSTIGTSGWYLAKQASFASA